MAYHHEDSLQSYRYSQKLYLKIVTRNIEHDNSHFTECSEDLENLRKEPQESASDRHRMFRHFSSLMRDTLDIKAAITLKKVDVLNKSYLSYLVASGFDRDTAIKALITTANEMPISIAKFELELGNEIEKLPDLT